MFGSALAACYSPSVADCQFACGPGNTCPDGATCTDGICRTSTGSCGGSTVDAPRLDAPVDLCVTAPAVPAGCTTKFAIDGGCGVVCRGAPVAWLAAQAACNSASWKLAILDTLSKLAAVPSQNEQYWVGARRTTAATPFQWNVTNMTVLPALWQGGASPQDGQGEQCANLDRQVGRLVNDVPCTDPLRFLCTYP